MTSQILHRLAFTDTTGTDTASGAAAHGDVPALLLIHGWCGDRTVDPLLTRSSGDVRAISVDLPARTCPYCIPAGSPVHSRHRA